jgi:hypothetical protein
VFVLNVVDGCIPSDLGTGTMAEIEEERRLLHIVMTRAKDNSHLVVPQRFFTYGQSAQGDRRVYASRSRVIPAALLPLFDCAAWPVVAAASHDRGDARQVRLDIGTRMRSLWRGVSEEGRVLCNLYAITPNQEAIRNWAAAMNDSTGNMPPMPGVFPDYAAPIVRNQREGRELALVRWGMPTPPKYRVGKKTDPGLPNIRNVNSAHWRRWLGVESCCVVPFTSFSDNEVMADGSRPPIWFA